MRTKILLGSVLVLTLLLLMPSIPAIQHKVVKDEVVSEISEDFELEEIKELLDFPDVKHPILFVLVVMLLELRAVRALYLLNFAFNTETHQDRYDFDHPLLGIRAIWLLFTAWLWDDLWQIISNSLGWNWELM